MDALAAVIRSIPILCGVVGGIVTPLNSEPHLSIILLALSWRTPSRASRYSNLNMSSSVGIPALSALCTRLASTSGSSTGVSTSGSSTGVSDGASTSSSPSTSSSSTTGISLVGSGLSGSVCGSIGSSSLGRNCCGMSNSSAISGN